MSASWEYHSVPMPDGRVTEVLTYGNGERGTLVNHLGTPGGLVPKPAFAALCDDLGLRYVSAGRPGYAHSSPMPGRVVADLAEDIESVLDHLGVDRFISIGGSGGGPHVLACAALLPERCRAAAAVVSPAPIDAVGLDYYTGMGEENREEWLLAEQGREVIEPWLKQTVVDWRDISAESFTSQYADTLAKVDVAAFDTEFSEVFFASLTKAISTGAEGWLEDDLALVTPWGFDLSTITTPVSVWTGKLDQMVSYEHSVWLARAIPGADLHVIGNHGHLSLLGEFLTDIVEDLLRKAAM